jgi:hypothetical protein
MFLSNGNVVRTLPPPTRPFFATIEKRREKGDEDATQSRVS